MYRNTQAPLLVTSVGALVIAHERTSGHEVWRYDGRGAETNHYPGRVVVEPPYVVCAYQRTSWVGFAVKSSAIVVCLDYDTGAVRWQYEVDGLDGSWTTTLLLDSGQVVLAYHALFAFDLVSGVLLWSKPAEGRQAGEEKFPIALAVAGHTEHGDT